METLLCHQISKLSDEHFFVFLPLSLRLLLKKHRFYIFANNNGAGMRRLCNGSKILRNSEVKTVEAVSREVLYSKKEVCKLESTIVLGNNF